MNIIMKSLNEIKKLLKNTNQSLGKISY